MPAPMAAPGVPLLRIEDARQHEVDIQVNESVLSRLRPGNLVQVSMGSGNSTDARIREIVPSGDPAAHTFTVKIPLPASAGLYSGMTAKRCVADGRAECDYNSQPFYQGARPALIPSSCWTPGQWRRFVT